ncbi:hypothetical protein D3C84_994810 [compost metagenome]
MIAVAAVTIALALVAGGVTAAHAAAMTGAVATTMAATAACTATTTPAIASGIGGVDQGYPARQDGARRQDHRAGRCGQQGFLIDQFGASIWALLAMTLRLPTRCAGSLVEDERTTKSTPGWAAFEPRHVSA